MEEQREQPQASSDTAKEDLTEQGLEEPRLEVYPDRGPLSPPSPRLSIHTGAEAGGTGSRSTIRANVGA